MADNIVTQFSTENQVHAESLKEDLQTASSLETTVREYERDLQNELRPRLAEVENILHQLEQRGIDFFDTTMRITNIQQKWEDSKEAFETWAKRFRQRLDELRK